MRVSFVALNLIHKGRTHQENASGVNTTGAVATWLRYPNELCGLNLEGVVDPWLSSGRSIRLERSR